MTPHKTDWRKARQQIRGALAGGVLFLQSCTIVPDISEADLPSLNAPLEEAAPLIKPITRQAVIQTARRYASHRWTPTDKNLWHGYDPQGIRVDTPNNGFTAPGVRPGWWNVGQENQGMPYKWGGYSSLAEFDAGLAAGFAAGDILTPEKRMMLDQDLPTISGAAVGIDASGFVSRCLGLPREYSTRELPDICELLPNYDALKAGDLLNLKGVHVILFEQFADRKHKALLGYEAGAPPSWKVLYNQLPLGHLKRLGYKPLRYQGIIDQADDAAKLGLREFAPEPPASPAQTPPPAASSTTPVEEPAQEEKPNFGGPGTV